MKSLWRRIWGGVLTYLLAIGAYAFFRVFGGEVHGRHRLDQFFHDGGILVANHSSYMDWFVLASIARFEYGIWPVFLAKNRLFEHWLFGPVMEFVRCIRVADDGSRILSEADLRNTKCLVVFPEGKRSVDGNIGRAHTGAVRYAAMFRKPIFPVGLRGFYAVWPPHRWLPRPGQCHILCAAPREVLGHFQLPCEPAELAAETSDIMKQIAEMVAKPAECTDSP